MLGAAHLQAVIFDWPDTLVDHGGKALADGVGRAFAAFGVAVTEAEARAAMGMAKREHLAAVMIMPRVRDASGEAHGEVPGADDVERVYAVFEPMTRCRHRPRRADRGRRARHPAAARARGRVRLHHRLPPRGHGAARAQGGCPGLRVRHLVCAGAHAIGGSVGGLESVVDEIEAPKPAASVTQRRRRRARPSAHSPTGLSPLCHKRWLSVARATTLTARNE